MEFGEVLKNRHSVRSFKEKDIPEEQIRRILRLANLSPSAGNLQARKVIIVRDRKIKAEIAQAALNQDFIVKAPIVFVICADQEESASKYGKRGRELYSVQDATIFASYLQLAAASFNLGSCWLGAFKEHKIKEILHLPSKLFPIAIIPIGYPDEEFHKTPRKSLKEIVI